MPELELPLFRIIRVKDLSFSVNEKLFEPSKHADINVNILGELSYNQDTNFVIINLIASYFYKQSNTDDTLAVINVQNIFELPTLKDFILEGDLFLPQPTIITLVSISLSHTRALLAKSVDGTAYNATVMPLIDPVDFSKKVFPGMFNETRSVSQSSKTIKSNKKKKSS